MSAVGYKRTCGALFDSVRSTPNFGQRDVKSALMSVQRGLPGVAYRLGAAGDPAITPVHNRGREVRRAFRAPVFGVDKTGLRPAGRLNTDHRLAAFSARGKIWEFDLGERRQS